MKQEENKLLPVPLKYTYPVLMETRFLGKQQPYFYVPEINKWIRKYELKNVLERLGLNRFVWELRWIYKVDGKTLADKNILANKIVEVFYSSKFENTKKYIKSKLLEDINYKCDFYCLRSDIIDLFYKNQLESIYVSWYDFSKVPVFIKTRQTKFTLIVKEKDFSTGEDIEDWTTDFDHFIFEGYEASRVGKHKSSILILLENGKKFKESAKNKFGSVVDYSQVEYKGSDYPVKLICKVCGNIYYQTPESHLVSGESHGCKKCNEINLSGKYSATFDYFVSKSRKVHGDRYTYYRDEYINYNTPTKIYDNNRKEFFYQKPSKHVSGHGNNECQNSMGEGLIKTWLVDNSINFNYGVVIKGLIHGRNIDRVIIDFTVNLNDSVVWIEYQGIQHYKRVEYFDKDNSTFEKQLQRDENVREYCKNNHIQLIEIPYIYKDYESVKELLDRVILNGEDINSIIDYQSLYNS